MKIERDWEAGTLHLSQQAAVEKLAVKFGLTDKGNSIPMEPTLKLHKTPVRIGSVVRSLIICRL